MMIAALWGLTDCQGDETVTAYGAGEATWQLVEIDGQPFAALATLSFADEGRLAGQAPCNKYFGEQSAPYPWFTAENIVATRMACSDLAVEATYFTALEEMTLSEVSGEALILSNDAGREMVFTAQ
jgi:heat shock protein HslJ